MLVLLLGCSLIPSSTGDTSPLDTAGGDTAVDDTGLDPDIEADDARVRALTDLPEGERPCAEPVLVRVRYTVDGDTFYADREDDGTSVKVRIIGVNCPEVAHEEPAECYGNEAWTFTAEQLEGRLAWLTFDADCYDDYDRTLAYVIRGEGADGFFDRVLARRGYARELTISPNDTFADDIRADVAAAQDDHLGMWGECSG